MSILVLSLDLLSHLFSQFDFLALDKRNTLLFPPPQFHRLQRYLLLLIQATLTLMLPRELLS